MNQNAEKIVRQIIKEQIERLFEVEDVADNVMSYTTTEKIAALNVELEKQEAELKKNEENMKSEVKPQISILSKAQGQGEGPTEKIASRDKANKSDELKYYKQEEKDKKERIDDLKKQIELKKDEIKKVQSAPIKIVEKTTAKETPEAPSTSDILPAI